VDGQAHMRHALALAERGRGTVSPNPLVGCVVVKDGRVVGEGWHQVAGGPHAEVAALADAGALAAGSTVYVTLEPCAHTGRTAPCTRALLDAGVARVVAAVRDPDPAAAGGAAVLRGAGVPVDIGLLGPEAARQNRAFLHAVTTGRPFVVAKAAVSLDGRIAAADGSSQWLTAPETRQRAHRLRAEADAVLVGAGTALADDPRLTVRLPGDQGRPPLRVVLDGRARLPLDAHLLDGTAPTLVVVAPTADPARVAALRTTGADVATVPLAQAQPASPPPLAAATLATNGTTDPASSRHLVAAPDPAAGPEEALARRPRPADDAAAPVAALDLRAVLGALHARGVRSVLVEGGAAVLGALVRAGLVDEFVVHVAPVLLGERGRPLLAGDGIGTLAGAPRLRPLAVERVGDDTVITLAPAPVTAPVPV
jgi:diaminohydroxyphosphoribosylaminopyrimidine deaminase/5-amino-6-(5-phosphoribosylamino)uracil reductase